MNVKAGRVGTRLTGTGFAALVAAGLALGPGAFAEDEPAAQPPATPARQLDLRAPELTKLYTHKQLETLIAKMEAEALERIEVEGARVPPPTFTPRVWPAIAAPFWALLHPTQAWRIFAPIAPDQARDIGNEKPTTDGYLEPMSAPSGDPFRK
jgi:hypothetical protein